VDLQSGSDSVQRVRPRCAGNEPVDPVQHQRRGQVRRERGDMSAVASPVSTTADIMSLSSAILMSVWRRSPTMTDRSTEALGRVDITSAA